MQFMGLGQKPTLAQLSSTLSYSTISLLLNITSALRVISHPFVVHLSVRMNTGIGTEIQVKLKLISHKMTTGE